MIPFRLGSIGTGAGDPVDPPAAPTALVVTETGSSNNDLDWTDNADNEDGFEVWRNFERGTFELLTDAVAADAEHYDDDAAHPPPTVDAYRVRAFNAGGESAWLDHVPVPVTDLFCADFAILSRSLTWTLQGGNPDISTGVEIQRNVNAAGWATIHTTAANVTNYEDEDDLTLSVGQSCDYRVREVNSVGSAAWSNTESGTLSV